MVEWTVRVLVSKDEQTRKEVSVKLPLDLVEMASIMANLGVSDWEDAEVILDDSPVLSVDAFGIHLAEDEFIKCPNVFAVQRLYNFYMLSLTTTGREIVDYLVSASKVGCMYDAVHYNEKPIVKVFTDMDLADVAEHLVRKGHFGLLPEIVSRSINFTKLGELLEEKGYVELAHCVVHPYDIEYPYEG